MAVTRGGQHFSVAGGIAISGFEIERITEGFAQAAHFFLAAAIQARQFGQ
jgi:hypothetical protein